MEIDLSEQNRKLLRCLLVSTNPIENTRFYDNDGDMLPHGYKIGEGTVVGKEEEQCYKINHIRDIFPKNQNDQFSKSFFLNLRKENVSKSQFSTFHSEEDDLDLDEIQDLYENKLSVLRSSFRGYEMKRTKELSEKNLARRKLIIKEIFSTEETYVRSLELFLERFVQPMKSFDPDYHSRLLSLTTPVLEVNRRFYRQLLESESSDSADSSTLKVARIFLSFQNEFKHYFSYVNEYEPNIREYSQKQQSSPKFLQLMTRVQGELKSAGERACAFPSFLIMPVQRLPRYCLLLRDLRKRVDVETEDYRVLDTAYNKFEELAGFINEKKRETENKFKLIDLVSKFGPKLPGTIGNQKLMRDASCHVDLLHFGQHNLKGMMYIFEDNLLVVTKNAKHVLVASFDDADVRVNQREHHDSDFSDIINKKKFKKQSDSPTFELENNDHLLAITCESCAMCIEFVKKIREKIMAIQKNLKFDFDLIQRTLWQSWLKIVESHGSKHTRYKKRWFVLTNDGKMKFFTKKNHGKFIGSFSVVGASFGRMSMLGKDNKFFIVMQKKTYYLKALDGVSLEKWEEKLLSLGCKKIMKELLKLVEKEIQGDGNPNLRK